MPRSDLGANTDDRQRRALQRVRIPLRATPTKTAAYTAKHNDMVYANPTGGGFTVTLPPATGHEGEYVGVKNRSASANVITIAAGGAETVDNAASITIAVAYGSYILQAQNNLWWVV